MRLCATSLCEHSGLLVWQCNVQHGSVVGQSGKKDSGHKRCIINQLGSSVQWQASLRHMDRCAEGVAYKPLGADGSSSSPSMFYPVCSDHHILIRTDDTAVVPYINHQGGVQNSLATEWLFLWANSNLLSIWAVHVPGRLRSDSCFLRWYS